MTCCMITPAPLQAHPEPWRGKEDRGVFSSTLSFLDKVRPSERFSPLETSLGTPMALPGAALDYPLSETTQGRAPRPGKLSATGIPRCARVYCRYATSVPICGVTGTFWRRLSSRAGSHGCVLLCAEQGDSASSGGGARPKRPQPKTSLVRSIRAALIKCCHKLPCSSTKASTCPSRPCLQLLDDPAWSTLRCDCITLHVVQVYG